MQSKKVLLISPASLAEAPYVKPYMDLFKREKIAFDFLFWNRKLEETSQLPSNYIPYNQKTSNGYSCLKKLFMIYGFYKFAKSFLKESEYSTIVIFTIQHAVFFESFLLNKFKGNFILDIRDNSPIGRISFFKRKLVNLIAHAATTVVSSEGFLQWLPDCGKDKYTIAHNVTLENICCFSHRDCDISHKDKLRILTIGSIRDLDSNSTVIKNLANNPHFELEFAGAGPAIDGLQALKKQLNASNVLFTGRYIKSDENDIVQKADMINIFFDHNINSDTLMSNRFYLSVMMRKPMIVNEGCFQAEQVRKYGLGVVIGEGEDMAQKIADYWKSFDSRAYNEACVQFLTEVENDIAIFNKRIIKIVL